MRHLVMPLLAAGVTLLSTGAAHADLGDQLFKLLADDGAQFDQFGVSVAISGASTIVGAWLDDDNGDRSGSAYLFDTTTGVQIAKLLPDDGAALDLFGISVAISGATVIVGADEDNDNGSLSGSAYLFDISDPANPIQTAKLLADDGAVDDVFGHSVAISGATAIVGARKDDDNGSDSGSAYLFDISDPKNPVQIAKLLADDGAAGDEFGWSVAISGDVAVVGADGDQDNGFDSGSAYLFDTTTGRQIAKLLPDDGGAQYSFGWSVAISGPTAIVGSPSDDGNGEQSGSAFLFDTTTGRQITKFLPDDGAAGDIFGVSVAIRGATAIVGAWGDDDNGLNSGSAYLFDISDPANPVQIAKLLANDGAAHDQFGISVAISDAPGQEAAIVAAHHDDDNGKNSGSAYVFDAAAPGMCPWDIDNSGDVGVKDLLFLLGAWGPCPPKGDCLADFDNSNDVGVKDLLILLGNWGPCS